MSELLELAPQFGVIVDLPVEGDYALAILGAHGLIPALEVDNLEADRS